MNNSSTAAAPKEVKEPEPDDPNDMSIPIDPDVLLRYIVEKQVNRV